MSSILRTAPDRAAILLVVAATAVLSKVGPWQGKEGNGWKETIRSDAKGYYGYLQAIFLRKDLGGEPYQWEYVRHTEQGTLNKYFAGTSVSMLPWFAAGHAVALLDPDAPRDGLSKYEMGALFLAAWCYLLIGLWAMAGLLRNLGVRPAAVAWTILAFGFGSTLIQYAGFQPGWSHIHSFWVVALFLRIVQRLALGAHIRWSIAAAALFGLIVLIRPVNGLVLLAVPVVTGNSARALVQRWWSARTTALASVLMAVIVMAIQPVLWKVQTGHWLAYGYEGEGFQWDRPELFKVLFGFRRGLFLWTPVLLLAALGTLLLWRHDRFRAGWLTAYWAINSYVISCWWIWYYGSGFGARVFVDHYPVLAIPFALLLQRAGTRLGIAARIFVVVCIVLHLFQLWQYHLGILHAECMDRAKYAWAFGRWRAVDRDRLGGNYQEAPFNPNGMEVLLEESCDIDNPCTYWHPGHVVHHPRAYSMDRVIGFDPSVEYGIAFELPPGSAPPDRALFLEVGYQRYEERAGDSFGALGVTVVQEEGRPPAYYEPFPIDPVPNTENDHWEQIEYRIPVPPVPPGASVKFYFWNKDLKARFLVDDVFMRVNAVRPY
jgi:hypothetical protein